MNFSLISAINIGANSNRTCINMWLNKQNVAICKYLFYKGLIDTYVISKEKRLLHIYFSFFYEKKPILFIKQLSKPGRRLSMKYSKLASLFKNRKHLLCYTFELFTSWTMSWCVVSIRISWWSSNLFIAPFIFTIAGIPYSRATTAPWLNGDPISVIIPPIIAK